MTHIFVSPHPDDAALSCGGLIASLRELGQAVTIISVYSGGPEASTDMTDYQRKALGFGTKALWPLTEAFDRNDILPDYPLVGAAVASPPWAADATRLTVTQERANTQARQFWQRAAWTRSANVTNEEGLDRPLADSISSQGTLDWIDLDTADAAAIRRAEDERYAWFIEASIVDLGLPDAVHRGYAGDDQLLGGPRDDDDAPVAILRREIMRLEPQQVYIPLGIGNHVDHVLCREVGLALLAARRSWVMPAPDLGDKLSFYEDFPYAWWNGFEGLADLPDEATDLPSGLAIEARYADISEFIERKIAGVAVYASQIPQLFHDEQGMRDDIAGHARRVAYAGGIGTGAAERYWAVVRP